MNRGSIRPSKETKDKMDKIISQIHIKTEKKLTQEEYMQEANKLMAEKYGIKEGLFDEVMEII